MEKITIKDVGHVTVPERNTREEVINIVNTLKHDLTTLNEMFIIEPIEIFWCENEACLEVTEPFYSEKEFTEHNCKCSINEYI
jgi:hypothetical protein